MKMWSEVQFGANPPSSLLGCRGYGAGGAVGRRARVRRAAAGRREPRDSTRGGPSLLARARAGCRRLTHSQPLQSWAPLPEQQTAPLRPQRPPAPSLPLLPLWHLQALLHHYRRPLQGQDLLQSQPSLPLRALSRELRLFRELPPGSAFLKR
ncbi:hypothetical protein I79_004009 [Cricetulus griseus]|uniref:Uncharacterized protein n=1 Tax=Cricetulus griseus TaxID=10029 RepID=G3H1I2_CRIGR|nr:hypothetical protein I79_004009 [Cricetulus griseus]